MPRIGVVVSTFPRPVDAYVLRELVALGDRGIDVRIYSLRRPAGNAAPAQAQALRERTVYPPPLASAEMARAHASFLRRRSARYASTFGAVVANHARSPRLLAKVLAVWPQTVYFASRARADRLDHVHANWATYPAAAAFAIGRLTGLPWSFAGHASDIYLEAAGLAEKIRRASFVTTCTAESRRYLASIAGDVDPGRVRTVYHGTDLAAFRVERREPDDLHILAVGTLRHCKGYDTLLRAAGRLRAGGIPTRVTIVGDGEERHALARLAHALGLDGEAVTFTGYLPHERLADLYATATVLVHPARSATHFGIPNVIIEAQAASLPVVCTPLPALRELIEDGTSGVYVAEEDVDGLVSALRALFEEPARRRRLAAEGLRRVTALFDIAETAEVFVGLFANATGTSQVREAHA
jgi:glycosyltransferase involved in cell wall biosynthesis